MKLFYFMSMQGIQPTMAVMAMLFVLAKACSAESKTWKCLLAAGRGFLRVAQGRPRELRGGTRGGSVSSPSCSYQLGFAFFDSAARGIVGCSAPQSENKPAENERTQRKQ